MSIESLRKLRAQTEEAITMELAQITQELLNMEMRCRALDTEIQSDVGSYRLQTEQGLTIESMLEWQGRMGAQEAALGQARQAIHVLNDSWQRTQARLVEATQARKVLDRLAERRQQAHRTEVGRREQQALDEAAHRRRSPMGTGTS